MVDKWITFLQDKWLFVVIAIVVIYIALKLVKSFVKWVIVLVIVGIVIYYGSHYTANLHIGDLKTALGKAALTEVEQQFTLAIAGDAKDAVYHLNADGSYSVSTKRLKLTGQVNSSKIKVVFMGQTFTVAMDSKLQKFIDQAKQNA